LKRLSPIHLGGDYTSDIELEGAFLDDIQVQINDLLDQLLGTEWNDETLLRYERLYAIEKAATLEERRANVRAQLAKTGGLSKAYFTGLAAAFGCEVEIEDMRPFEAGIGMAGYPIWEEGIKWCWTVRVLNHTYTSEDFEGKDPAGYNAVGDPYLWTWAAIAGPMEKLFHTLKPPGGMVLFIYPS
jgi:uncharacterized protein YmfQ (DUF2313 family)